MTLLNVDVVIKQKRDASSQIVEDTSLFYAEILMTSVAERTIYNFKINKLSRMYNMKTSTQLLYILRHSIVLYLY